MAEIILFHEDTEAGSHLHVFEAIGNLGGHYGFDNVTSSLVVIDGTWELFGDENFKEESGVPGKKKVTVNSTTGLKADGKTPGGPIHHTDTLGALGLKNDDLSSLRPV